MAKRTEYQDEVGTVCSSLLVGTFDEVTTATFSGKAVCFKGEKRKISDVSFTPPKPLPADCSWGTT
jgi:hypothetical protein